MKIVVTAALMLLSATSFAQFEDLKTGGPVKAGEPASLIFTTNCKEVYAQLLSLGVTEVRHEADEFFQFGYSSVTRGNLTVTKTNMKASSGSQDVFAFACKLTIE